MSSPRLFNGQTVGQINTSLGMLFDPSQVSTDGATTGMWRASQPSDFAANVSVSGGLSVSVGNVAVTGGQLSLIGTSAVIVQGGYIAITGTHNTAVTGGSVSIAGTPTVLIGNAAPIAVSGNFGSTPTNTAVTGIVTVSGVGTFATAIVGTPSFLIANGIVPVSGIFTATQGPVTILSTANTGAPLAVSGAFAATIGNIAVTGGAITIANPILAVSGAFSSSVTVGNVAITGQVNTYNGQELALLSGISGALTSNLSAPAFVTGQVSILGTPTVTFTNTTLNVATTGNSSTTISNPIGVTGTSTDVNASITGAHPYNFLSIGGRATLPTGAGSASGYNVGDYAMLNINAQNGGIYVNQGTLDQTQDNVTIWYASTGVAATIATSGISNGGFGLALAANPNRRQGYIQNTATGALLIGFGTGVPTTGSFNILLAGGTVAFDGKGGIWNDHPAIYTGPVTVSGIGPAPSWTAWQL